MASRFANIVSTLTEPPSVEVFTQTGTAENPAIKTVELKAVKPEPVEPKSPELRAVEPAEPKEVAKSKDSGYKRTTVYLPKALLKKIKIAAAQEELMPVS